MKSLRSKDEKKSFYNLIYNNPFTDDELCLFYDLIAFNHRYEEAFFTSEPDENILKMIDSVISEKLKIITPTLAFKFLNRLWTLYSEGTTTLDEKIINNIYCNLTANRFSIQLLDKATDDDELYYSFANSCNGLENYLIYNFYCSFCNLGLKANKMLTLDHVELFLALLNEADNIEENLINKITDIYLFLYKDIYDEVLRNNLTKTSTTILSRRFDGYEKYIINKHTNIKKVNFSIQFTSVAMKMLDYKDNIINPENLEYLKVGKIYLDTILMQLKEFEKDTVLSYYQENENTVDTRECVKALSYVKKSINESDKQKRES